MTDPLSTTASILTIAQISSKVIAFINGVKGGETIRKRLRDEVQSYDSALRKLQNDAEDFGDGDAWLETIKILKLPNALLHHLEVTLGLITERLEPTTEASKTLSLLTWPFWETEAEGMISATGRQIGLLNITSTNDCQRLIRENCRMISESTAKLAELGELSQQTSEESFQVLRNMVQSIQYETDRSWKENAKQWEIFESRMASIQEFMVKDLADKSCNLKESLEAMKESSFQHESSLILDHLNMINERLSEEQENALNSYTGLKHKVEQISSYTNVSFQRLSDNIANFYKQFEHNHQQQISKEDEEKNVAILDWLSVVDYARQQSNFMSRRQPGTGGWLLESKEFLEWIDGGKTLFCSGIPGSGKTILTSIVVEYLRNRFPIEEGYAVAYIYCSFKSNEQTCAELVANLLKQVARHLPRVPHNLQTLYTVHAKHNTRPYVEECTAIIHTILPCFRKVFLLVDALDECSGPSGSREKFLSTISELQNQYSGLHFFTTSRFDIHIAKFFQQDTKLEILAVDHDVEAFVCAHISSLSHCVRRDVRLQRDVVLAIVNAARGMFLLAHFLLESLKGKRTVNAVRQAIRLLPFTTNTYQNVYEESMSRINGRSNDDAMLAHNIFKWLSCAKQHLTLIELQHALAVKPISTKIDESDIYSLEDLISVCAGLVTFDESSGIIRLAHYTTQEYFIQTREVWFPNAENDLAKVCLTYLFFDEFGSGACSRAYVESGPNLVKRLQHNPFYQYASSYWGHHVRNSSGGCPKTVSFLKSRYHVESSNEARSSGFAHHQKMKVMHWTGLHLAAFFGLQEIEQLSHGAHLMDVRDAEGRTPLSIASAEGYYALVEMLLACSDVDPESEDVDGRTSLSYAAENRHPDIVVLMLKIERINPDSVDKYGRTPASYAAGSGDIRVVQTLLVMEGVDFNKSDNDGRSPLSYAALNGHASIVALLLEQPKTTGNSKDLIDGQTPLSLAAGMGHDNVVKLLISSSKVRVNSRTSTGESPLMLATLNGFPTTIELLLSHPDTRPNISDESGNTPLLVATCNGTEAVVRSLLRHPAINVNAKDEDGTTPIFLAASRANEKLLNMLLAHPSIEPDCVNKQGDTPLIAAAWNGSEAIMTALLKHSTRSINVRNKNKESPISRAVANGHEQIIKILLEQKNLKPNRRDSWGSTPLTRAVEERKDKIVELLLQHKNIRPNCKDIHKNTALTIATRSGRVESVRKLLAHRKTNPNCKDWRGQTPYHEAEIGAHAEVMGLLLDRRGVDPDLGIKAEGFEDPALGNVPDESDDEWFIDEDEDDDNVDDD